MIRTTFELAAEDRMCDCGREQTESGQAVTRELERLEIAVVHEIARKKYACHHCAQSSRVAPGPDRVLDKGILGVGFLAHVLVERFGHHMPYNRLESKYAFEGFDLSRSVLCESSVRCAEILEPIATQILVDALATGVVETDDTPVVIQEGSDKRSRKSRVWVYRGLGGQVYFDMTESRGRDGPKEILAGYAGYLQADTLKVYDAFYKDEKIKEVACWAHARRYFVDAEGQEPALVKDALDRIGELYAVERVAKEKALCPEELHTLRQQESLPRLSKLHDWLSATEPKVPDKGE